MKMRIIYEKGTVMIDPWLDLAAQTVFRLVQQTPLAISQLPCFRAEKMADWLQGKVEAGSTANRDPGIGLRLGAIKHDSKTLVEYHYSEIGRLQHIDYADGERVSYDWDDSSHARHVRSRTGRRAVTKLRPDGLVDSITYDNRFNFQYDYDICGNLIRLTYPDGISATRSYGPHGVLTMATCGKMSVVHKWTSKQDYDGYVLRSGSEASEFKVSAHRQICELRPDNCDIHAKPPLAVHPLGIWQMTSEGGLEEMVTPFGERFRVHASVQGRPVIVWSPAGQHLFDYDRDGLLSAVTDPDGSRSMIHVLKDQPKALLVNPNGVTLLEYDEAGRLRKTRSNDGDYTLLYYARDGSVRKIETFQTGIQLGHDKEGQLSEMKHSNGTSCVCHQGANKLLDTITVTNLNKDSMAKVSDLLGFFWQWWALNATLRLRTMI